jgi:hypothetical protein
MDSSRRPALAPDRAAAAQSLVADLRRVFAERLHSVVAYDAPPDHSPELHTLVLVASLTFDDLAACASSVDGWHRAGLAVPLLLSRDEFSRSLDAFPLEFGEIIARHVVILGQNPFEGVAVAGMDLRRGCEQQAKSHLIHLREGFLEARRRPRDLARLIVSSAPAFRTLLTHIARLDGSATESDPNDEGLAAFAEARIGVSAALVRDVFASPKTLGSIADPTPLLGKYITVSQHIWEYVDAWRYR